MRAVVPSIALALVGLATAARGAPPALEVRPSGGPLVAALRDAGGAHLLAFPAREAGPLAAQAALWDGARAIEAAEPYGALPPHVVLRSKGNVAWWTGRRRLAVVTEGERPRLVEDAAPAPRPGRFGPPALVGVAAGADAWAADAASYSAFAVASRSRRAVVYADADDGLLHAFDAESGAEAFALRLAPPGGAPEGVVFEDVYLDAPWAAGGRSCPSGRACQWRTLLAARAAEGGLLVLDVTRPDAGGVGRSVPTCLHGVRNDAACDAVWPAAVAESRRAGARLTLPAFARVRLEGLDGKAFPRAALVAGFSEGDARRGGIVLIDAATGRTLAEWSAGRSPEGARRIASVTATPAAVDSDGDGVTDGVWFGDAAGAVWRLRLPRDAPASRLAAELLFDGGRDPRTAGAVERTPAVFLSRGALHVAFAVDRPGGALVVVPDAASGALAWIDRSSPVLASCGAAGPARESGWALALAPGERVAAAPLVLGGYVYLATSGEGTPPTLYRLAAGGGEPCRGADCCGAGEWRAQRGVALSLPAGAEVSELAAGLDEEETLRLWLLAAAPGKEARLVTRTLGLRTELRKRRFR